MEHLACRKRIKSLSKTSWVLKKNIAFLQSQINKEQQNIEEKAASGYDEISCEKLLFNILAIREKYKKLDKVRRKLILEYYLLQILKQEHTINTKGELRIDMA